MFLSEDLQHLTQFLTRLPGLGQRSAKRVALHLLKTESHKTLIQHLERVASSHNACTTCGYIDSRNPCFFCTSPHREMDALCIVADTGDVWALEKAAFFKGRYHILGGTLSAFDGKGPENLFIHTLPQRLQCVDEVILAMDGTLEGQTTLNYLAQSIAHWAPHVSISSLARGMPVGGELDYIDQGTLMSAFLGRQRVHRLEEEARGWLGISPMRGALPSKEGTQPSMRSIASHIGAP